MGFTQGGEGAVDVENPRFMIGVIMAEHERERSRLNRHAWKRPPEPKPKGLMRRAAAALWRR